jgi:competence protein ComEA
MKTLWALAFGVLFGLLAAGLLFLIASPPRGEAIRLAPPPTPPPLIVHVSGAVARPGVCKLAPGSRLQDAVQAAGGLTGEADDQALNLAAPVQDGDLIRVPIKQQALEGAEQPLLSSQPEAPGRAPDLGTPVEAGGPVDINTADQEQLEELPGIGPVTAQKIVDHRQENGPFASIEAIQDVSGIGPATFEKIKALITVGNYDR